VNERLRPNSLVRDSRRESWIMTMPSAYFAWTICPEVRAPTWATFVDHPQVEGGSEGSGLAIVNVCVLLTAGLAGVYIAVAWMIEKVLSVIAG
jgi:hypothetical protein